MEEAVVFWLRLSASLWLAISWNSYCFLSGNRTSGSNVAEKTMSKVVWNQTVIGRLIIDDIETFSDHGLEAVCCAAFIDRNLGGIDSVAKHPTKVVSVCSLHDAFQILQLVDQETVDATKEYLEQNQFSEMGSCSKINFDDSI